MLSGALEIKRARRTAGKAIRAAAQRKSDAARRDHRPHLGSPGGADMPGNDPDSGWQSFDVA